MNIPKHPLFDSKFPILLARNIHFLADYKTRRSVFKSDENDLLATLQLYEHYYLFSRKK